MSDEPEQVDEELVETPVSETPEPEPAPPAWHESLKAAGYDPSTLDESKLADGYIQAQQLSQQLPTLQQYANYGRHVAPHWDKFQAWHAQQNQPQAEPAAPPTRPARPEFKPEWLRLVKENPESGQLMAAYDGIDPSLPNKVQAYLDWRRDQQNLMLEKWQDPDEMMKSVEAKAAEIAQAKIQEFYHSQSRQQAVLATLQDVSPWAQQRDQAGNLVVNPSTGQPYLTQKGEEYVRAVAWLHSRGMTDPQDQDRIARTLIGMHPTPNTPDPVDKKKEFLDRSLPPGAGRQVNRIGSALSAEENDFPQNSEQRFGQMLHAAFGTNGTN